MTAASEQKRILSFPKRKSIGSLYYAPISQPEEWQLLTQVRGLIVAPENEPIHWELLDEAKGNIAIPDGTKIKLKISPDAEHIEALAELKPDDLHALDLGHSDVIDHSLAYVQHLTNLRSLELTSTSIGDHGLSFLSQLKDLQSLGLSYTRVTSEGLKYLKGLLNLREIWLSGTQVDDLGLALFSELQLLVQLGLSGTQITDAGLLSLAKLKNLLRIYLFNTTVTHNGTQLLRKLLPGCRVKWHPPKIHTLDAENTSLGNSTLIEVNESQKEIPTSNMTEDDFWQLIDLMDWQKSGNDEAVILPVVDALANREVQDILRFAEILSEKLYALDGKEYAQEIGTDAYEGNKGNFAKNWFLYVRCCVIANGRDYYLSVLGNPDLMPKDIEFQALLAIVPQAYKACTGQRYAYTTSYNYETFSNKELWATK